MASKSLNASVLFDYEQADHTKTSTLHMDVILTAPERDDQKRIPLHLILAVDCSGSMAGAKIESVRNTIMKLIDHMTENDTLGIIGFSENVFDVLQTMPMTQSNKDQARTAVKGIRDMGATNLSQAIIMAGEKAVTGEKDKVCRIVLLTDGLPTSGDCNKESLVKLVGKMNQTVSLTSFGYGMDYDAELLASLASMGRGNNFYIEKDSDCNKAFALELGGLLSLYAQDIKVTITPSGNMTIKELLSGYKLEEQAGYRAITPGKASYEIDDIYIGEKKHAVLKIEIPSATEAVCARATRVADVKVEYLDVETKEKVEVVTTAKIQYVKPGKVAKDSNEEVKKQLVLIEAARIQKEAKEKADKGDYNGAQIILNSGIAWAQSDGVRGLMGPQGVAGTVGIYQNMIDNSTDRFTYATKGVKLANSYMRGMSASRGSSGDAVAMSMSYTSSLQQDMLCSFEEPASAKLENSVGVGSIKTISGNDPLKFVTSGTSSTLILKKDDDEEETK